MVSKRIALGRRNCARPLCAVPAVILQVALAAANAHAQDLPSRRCYLEFSSRYVVANIWKIEKETVTASLLETHGQPEEDRFELSEGYYVGFYYAPDAASGKNSLAGVMRIQVLEVEEGNKVSLIVGAEAMKRLQPNGALFLRRPFNVTTSELRALPDVAEIELTDKAELDKLLYLARSKVDMMDIGLAMQDFHIVYRHFPPAAVYGPDGKPWHSWRTLLLPYLQERVLYDSYDFSEPWDSPKNLKLARRAPNAFRDEIYGEADPGITHYAAITGAQTAFPSEGAKLGDDLKLNLRKTPGMASVDDFVDGRETTLLVGPVPAEARIPWTKPEDLTIRDDFPPPGAQGGFGLPYAFGDQRAGAFLLATDGNGAIALTDAVSPRVFRGLLTIAGGESIDAAKLPRIGPLPRWPREKHFVLEVGIRPDGATARFFVNKPPPRE